MNYRIGLDIGIASVGWSVMELDAQNQPTRIEDLGVRKFNLAEKDGCSPAVDRRLARGIRRTIRRKRSRLNNLKAFLSEKLLDGKDITFEPIDLIVCRCKALDERIDDNTLARIIYSLAKHRGFKSNRKAELEDSSNGTLNKVLEENTAELKNYRSIAEMYCAKDEYHNIREKSVDGKTIQYTQYTIRNKNGSLEKTLQRADVLNEMETILKTQQKLGNKKISDSFIDEIKGIIDYQKSYDAGPDQGPYRVTFNVGKCTFFSDEPRAPKASFSYEYFSALCDINNLKVNGEFLSQEKRDVLKDAFLKYESIKYGKVRKLLNLTEDDTLTGKSGCDKAERVFLARKASYPIMKTLSLEGDPREHWDFLDEVAYCLSMYKSDEKRIQAFKDGTLTKELSEQSMADLCALDFNKFGNLSIKALKMIVPNLEKGANYTDACTQAGLHLPSLQKSKKLKYADIVGIQDVTSPVARRAISQTIKVVNAIIDKYGSPCGIHVELAREFGKPASERKKIMAQQEKNFAKNEDIVTRLKEEFGILHPSGQDILKLKLYEEQNGKSAYNRKSFIEVLGSVKAIFQDNNTQIDHIIPISRCCDDSYSNKVLVFANENQAKGNRLPFEYLGNDKEKWNAVVAYAQTIAKGSKRKAKNLLTKSLSENQERELGNRALNDTRYISVFVKDMFEKQLLFNPTSSKRPVKCVNGALTSFVRKICGLPKERFADDKHHAVDAVIVACVDEGLVQRTTKMLQLFNFRNVKGTDGKETSAYVERSTGEILQKDELALRFGSRETFPYPNFRKEVELRLYPTVLNHKDELAMLGYDAEEISRVRPLYVSRMADHKVTGAMHEQTVRSKKYYTDDSPFVVSKTPITSLKLDEKTGEIKDYPAQFKTADPLLYEVLKTRLQQFDGDAKKAFNEPFYKPNPLGGTPNVVKSVKLQKQISDPIEINGGLAENTSMIRIDVYKKNGKNYFVPVYSKDFYNKKVPNKICQAKKLYKDWPIADSTYSFAFSLFANDLLFIKSKKGIKFVPRDEKAKKIEKTTTVLNEFYAYYISANRSTVSITIETIDGKWKSEGVGIQGLDTFQKCEISILGDIREIKNETLKEFK